MQIIVFLCVLVLCTFYFDVVTVVCQLLINGYVMLCYLHLEVARWRNRYSVGLAMNRSWVQILLEATLRNNLGQVVHTHVPLSPSSITWYQPKGGDALRLGR